MKKTFAIGFLMLLACSYAAIGQNKEKGVFRTYEPGYFQNSILKGIEDYESQKAPAKPNRVFKADVSQYQIPGSQDGFTVYWHNEPVSQGNTNTCWSFSTTSYLESEVFRITGQKVKLSPIYTVYCEYLERAREWVRTRGNMNFGEGSEGNAVTKIWKLYGALPYEAYTGLLPGQTFHSHEKMFNELKSYVEFVKQNNLWDENAVIANFKAIMNHYIGEPPATVTLDGRTYSPKEYIAQVLKVHPEDFVDVVSYLQKPFWEQVEYEVPDNWWHNADYYNLPLDDYMLIIKRALKQGYTLAIGGDVSEAGMVAREANAAVVPAFDIPSAFIDDQARQFRFSNGTTTDDHGMHIVGYKVVDGVTWFLVKDSSAGSRTGGKEKNKNFGYYFFHEDYVKLKMMDIMIHKDAMQDYLKKFSH